MKVTWLLIIATEKLQEAVLLDLLRVISHHRARLATPIRTVQKVYSDADMENIPFSDTIFTRAAAAVNRPLLLIEPSHKINGEDKAKPRAASRTNEDQATKTATTDQKPATATDGTLLNTEKQQEKKANLGDLQPENSKGGPVPKSSSSTPSKSPLESGEKPPAAGTGSEQAEVVVSSTAKNESERPAPSPSAAKAVFQKNIVLEVALEGVKKTLPIEEAMTPASPPLDAGELAASRSTNGSPPPNIKDRKGQTPASDQRGQDR